MLVEAGSGCYCACKVLDADMYDASAGGRGGGGACMKRRDGRWTTAHACKEISSSLATLPYNMCRSTRSRKKESFPEGKCGCAVDAVG